MNKERIKVALIGAGGWGRQHARVFTERRDVEFCAIVGRTPEKTQARATEFGTRAYTDIGEMLILAQKVTQTVDALVAKKQQEKP